MFHSISNSKNMKTLFGLLFSVEYIFVLVNLACARLFAGDTCAVNFDGYLGTCTLFRDCPEVTQNLTSDPNFCGLQNKQLFVCCPSENKQPVEISKLKCQEYASINAEPPPKIVGGGGTPSKRTEFPHMAAIGFEAIPGTTEWLCGGSLISPEYILTAAHCLAHHEKGNATWIKLGVIELNDTDHRQEIKVAQLIPHPEYRPSSHYHDIALIKLQDPVVIDDYVRPACLNTKKEVISTKVSATGWGVTELGEPSNILLKMEMDLFDYDSCSSFYKPYISRRLKKGIMEDWQICAGSTKRVVNTCSGDSGGPLQIHYIGGSLQSMYDIIGVTSFGTSCLSQMGVYVRVSHYIKWIEDIVWRSPSS